MAVPTDPFSDDFADDDFDDAALDDLEAIEREAVAARNVAGPSRQAPLFRGSYDSASSSALEPRSAPRRILAAQTPESQRSLQRQLPALPNASPNKDSSPQSVLQFVDSSPAFEIISPPHGAARQAAPSKAKPTCYDDSFDDQLDDWDDSVMAGMDQIEAAIQRGGPSAAAAAAAAGPSSVRISTGALRQRTLFGDCVPEAPSNALSWDKEGYARAVLGGGSSAGGSSEAVNGRGGAVGGLSTGAGVRACKTKQWDRTAYAKSGHRYRNAAGAKRKRDDEDDEDLQDEDGEPTEDWDRPGQVFKPPEPARDIIPE